jgi:hypothetical protein
MACGGCSERREAIVAAGRALAAGELRDAVQEVKVLAESAARDLRRAALNASRLRLKR